MAIRYQLHWLNQDSENRLPSKAHQEHEAPPPFPASQKQRSLDIPQRIEKRLARLNASESMLKRWSIELLSWTISAVCMGAIIGIAACLENGPEPTWLSTFTTILAKFAAATLIIPTSEAIGQLKWNWFNGGTSKEMLDFEIFDKASRGPWGAFMLLVRTRGKSLAALGAVLTLLMLAIDTFFQELIVFPQRWIVRGTGQVPRVVQYIPPISMTYQGGTVLAVRDQNLIAVTETFFYGNGTEQSYSENGTIPNIRMNCPTSNCTWPVYQTLGLCSPCQDASHFLTYACLQAKIDWTSNLTTHNASYRIGPTCGYFINATGDSPVLMSGYTTDSNLSSPAEVLLMRALPLTSNPKRELLFGGSVHFKRLRNPLANFIIASTGDDPETVYRNTTPPAAYECALHWCVKTIRSKYYRASYQEEILETFANSTPGPNPWQAWRLDTPGFNGTMVNYWENVVIDDQQKTSGERYGLTNETQIYTIYGLSDFLPSFTTIRSGANQSIMRIRNSDSRATTLRIPHFNPWLSPGNIPRHMERLANAMTDSIRSTSTTEYVDRQATEVEAYVSVRWGYVAFPVALLLFSFVFLVATIRKTSKEKSDVGVWKTSAMPALIYSLPKELQRSLTSDGPAWTTVGRAGAEQTRIKLLPNKGWRVSGYVSAPSTPTMRRAQAPSGWI